MRYKKPQLIILSFVFIAYITLISFQPSLKFLPNSIVWFVDKQRLLELILLSFVLIEAILAGCYKHESILVNKQIIWIFSIIIFLGSISALLSHAPRHAFIELSVFTSLFYFAFMIARLYTTNRGYLINGLIFTLWASILLYMVSFYTGYITATLFKTPLNWPFPFTGFSNIRSFNQYQLWGLSLICLPLLSYNFKSNINKVLLSTSLTLWWVLLFYSASRGALIACLLGALVTLLVYRRYAWPFFKLQLTQLVSGFIVYYVLFKIIPATNQSTIVTLTLTRETTEDRIALWNLAISLINKFPLLGVGPMHFAWYSQTNSHPHNSILQLASEWGIPTATLLISLAIFTINAWLKKFNVNTLNTLSNTDVSLTIIIFFTIVANALYSMVDGVIVTPISQVLMFTVIGLAIGFYVHKPIKMQETTTAKHLKYRYVFAMLVLTTLLCSTFPEIQKGITGHEKGFSMGYTALGPRFWFERK